MNVQGSCEWRDESKRFGLMIPSTSQGKSELKPQTCPKTSDAVTPIGIASVMEKQSVPRPKPLTAQTHCLHRHWSFLIMYNMLTHLFLIVVNLQIKFVKNILFNTINEAVPLEKTPCIPPVVLRPEQGSKPLCISPRFQAHGSMKHESFGPSLQMSPSQMAPPLSLVAVLQERKKNRQKGKDKRLHRVTINYSLWGTFM